MCTPFTCTLCRNESTQGSSVKVSASFLDGWSTPSKCCPECTKKLQAKPPNGATRVLASDLDIETKFAYTVHPGACLCV
jgi:uncharacterized protein (DUF2225 family)